MIVRDSTLSRTREEEMRRSRERRKMSLIFCGSGLDDGTPVGGGGGGCGDSSEIALSASITERAGESLGACVFKGTGAIAGSSATRSSPSSTSLKSSCAARGVALDRAEFNAIVEAAATAVSSSSSAARAAARAAAAAAAAASSAALSAIILSRKVSKAASDSACNFLSARSDVFLMMRVRVMKERAHFRALALSKRK